MYTQNAPTYDAIQWDGTNQEEIATRFLETVAEDYHLETKVQNGNLIFRFKYGMSETIPANAWLISEAGWGDGPRSSRLGLGTILSDADFQARFTTT